MALKTLRTLIIVFVLGQINSAVAFDQTSPPVLGDGWIVGSLSEAGFDEEKMHRLSANLESGIHPNAHMVLIEYDGKLVYEKYLSGEDQNWGSPIGHVDFDHSVKHDLRSISKSVTALLLGVAIGENFDEILSTSVLDYFPELQDKVESGVEDITLHHVLTMSEGLDWNEMQVPYSSKSNDEIQLYYAANPFKYVLRKSVRTAPGTSWYYNGGTTMLLAGVVQAITEKTFLSFAEEVLFKPLGISDYEWRGDNIWRRGLPAAPSGLRLRGRDLAKIGSLMMHGGQWNGKPIVPAEWISRSSIRHMEQTQSEWSNGGIYGYGYQWWHGQFTDRWQNVEAITGVGYGGQKLFVIPDRKLVVTIFGGNYGKGNWRMPENILAEIIAAAPGH